MPYHKTSKHKRKDYNSYHTPDDCPNIAGTVSAIVYTTNITRSPGNIALGSRYLGGSEPSAIAANWNNVLSNPRSSCFDLGIFCTGHRGDVREATHILRYICVWRGTLRK